ncbi:cache domain-containing protein, partial [Rhodovulum marinum]
MGAKITAVEAWGNAMLKKIFEMPISRRLPLSIAAIVLSVTGFMGFVLYQNAYLLQRDTTIHSLETLAGDQAERIEDWFANMRGQVASEASSPFVAATIRNFRLAVQVDGGSLERARVSYVAANPKPANQRQMLYDAGDGTAYSAVHKSVHPRFARSLSDLGYEDIFLFDPDGRLLYSAMKRSDFGQDFDASPLADTGLGIAFRAAAEASEGQVATVDFTAYAPAAGAPAAFMATPVFDHLGLRIGVLAIQIAVDELSSLVTRASALGQFGDMYVLGPDGAARTVSRFDGRFGVLEQLPPRPFIAAILGGQTGPFYGVEGIARRESLAFAVPLGLDWADWTLVAELDKAEYQSNLTNFQKKVALFVVVGLFVALVISILGSRTITGPLACLVRAMDEVARGRYDTQIPVADRGDELGLLGRSLAAFRDRLAETDELARAREAARLDQDSVVATLSASLQRLSAGDLSESLEKPFPEDYEQLRHDFNATV